MFYRIGSLFYSHIPKILSVACLHQPRFTFYIGLKTIDSEYRTINFDYVKMDLNINFCLHHEKRDSVKHSTRLQSKV